MALTALVKDELARYETSKASVRKAEISTILRFTGGLHIVSGRIVVEAEVDSEQTALRMQQTIAEIYGHEAEITSVSGGGLRRGGRYIVRVDAGGEALARQTGLLDLRGRPVRGCRLLLSMAPFRTPKRSCVVLSWHMDRSQNLVAHQQSNLHARGRKQRLLLWERPGVWKLLLKRVRFAEWIVLWSAMARL